MKQVESEGKRLMEFLKVAQCFNLIIILSLLSPGPKLLGN